MARSEAPAISTWCHPSYLNISIYLSIYCHQYILRAIARTRSPQQALAISPKRRSAIGAGEGVSAQLRDTRGGINRAVVTIGEAPGGEEACDTSSSSDGEDSSDDGEGSDDNALNRPIEQV